ncbi:hypothetical protein AMELA_G00146780 [Ameiurus melas]|uniref:Coiled-coil domain-containing protein 83 n=1 Tax=Ameiurus melas TaxID=219545 RepID=A0A7J6AGH0_AMEME|nr:hypothetical protein AMELA_G00146780 [Ameiurus melas]
MFQRDELREKHQGHLSVLRKQAKEQEKKLEEKEVASKEQVEQAVQYNLELAHIQEEELAEYIECSLKAAVSEIDKNTSLLIEREKHLARERALKQADKHSFQKIKKNDWLKKELAVYHEEVSILDAAVRKLEEENLEHMKELHRLNDAQISCNMLLMQAEDLEEKLSLPERTAEVGREQHQQSGELEEDEIDHSCKPSSPTHHLSTLLSGSQSDLRESLHLGLLEQKLLCVVGQAMPLSPLPSDPEDLDKLKQLGQIQVQDGILTTNIINKKFQ